MKSHLDLFSLSPASLSVLEHESQVFQVLIFNLVEYDDIIQVSNSKFVDSFQDLTNEGLKICWSLS